jgi:antitoxin ParD1/3/4
MDNATLTISLPKAMKSFIEAKLREGQFSTPSEYIRSLIRDDQHLAGNKELALLLRRASAPLQTAGAQAEETRKRRK